MRLIFVYRSEDKGVVPWGSRLEHKAYIARLKDAFALDGLFDYPTAENTPVRDDADMDIKLTGDPPPAARARRSSPIAKGLMQDVLAELLRYGHIRPSTSPLAAPVLFAAKPGGGLRFCVDFRALNRVTEREHFPIPSIDDLLDDLGNSAVFSAIDLYASYHQLRLRRPELTSFVTPHGQYEYVVVPFGLVNAPSAFSRFISNTLRPVADIAKNYLDDIALGSTDHDTHATDLCRVLQCLHAAGLRLNARKCSFFQSHLKYLGHVMKRLDVMPCDGGRSRRDKRFKKVI